MSKQNSPPNQAEIQKMIYTFQMLQKQHGVYIGQLDIINANISGLTVSLRTMEGLRDVDPDHEIILPLGKNVYTKAKIVDPHKMILNITQDILIERGLEDSITSIEELLNKNKEIRDSFGGQLQQLESQMNQLAPIVDQYYRQ